MDEKKVREAIERMSKIRNRYNATLDSIPESARRKSDYNNDIAAFDTAIEALEKQMAKKPEMRTAYNDFDGRLICYKGFCPSCGGVVESYRNESCHHCTQMLDWSE